MWILVAVSIVVPVLAWSLRDLRMENDVAKWLPQNDPQAKILAWYEELFPTEDRVLVSWDGCSITDPRMKDFAQKLMGSVTEDGKREGGSPYVDDVTLPTDLLGSMLAQGIPFEDALREIDGILIGQGPLKIQFTDTGRIRGKHLVREILNLANDRFGLNARVVNYDLPAPRNDIALEDSRAFTVYKELKRYTDSQPLVDLQLIWEGMHSDRQKTEEFRQTLMKIRDVGSGSQTQGKACIATTFFAPGSLAAVSVVLSEAGEAERDVAVDEIHAAVEAVGVKPEEIHLGGQPVVSVALNRAVKDAAWRTEAPWWDLPHRSPILLSMGLSVLISFVMLRSFRLATLVQVAAFTTVVIALAIVPLTGGTLSMVLVVMPTLLVVLTTSAAIHLSNYWRHGTETDPAESVFKAAEVAWMPCFLASATTAIGLASLLASNLVPVRDFGLYAAIGCGISFLVVLYVLPALMLYWPRKPPHETAKDMAVWNRLGRALARHRLWVSGICMALTIAAGYGLTRFQTETKVIRYFPEKSDLVQDYVFLEDRLAGVISIDTIVKFDTVAQQQLSFIERAQKVKELQEDIRRHPEISGVLSLASFLDLREPDLAEMSRFERQRYVRARNALGRKILQKLENKDEAVASMLARPDKAHDWLKEGDRQLNREGDELWRVTAQTSALSDANLEELIGDMNTIAGRHLALVESPHTGHVVTGLIPVFLRTQQAVLESLIRSFGMAFVLIAIVMMVVLRNPVAGFLTMLPNLMPVVLIFGLISWAGLKVDIGTMITASVALGIAVDGTLHLITWFRNLVADGVPVEEAVGRALQHCGPAMWQTSLAIGLGMIALLFADLLLVSRFGVIMFLLIFAALAADVLFLPALLGGRLGRLIQRSVASQISRPPAEPETATVVPLPTPGQNASAALKDAGGDSALKEVS